ncbi:MAG: PAS domain S-box protein [Desulfobacteraceae bacterium]|nr:MAG: PAS domain S-box protein [Desulfobacteraceae bacterium]
MKRIFSKTLALFIAGFCLFAFTYHSHQVRRIQHAVNEHAKIVAGSIWDLNPKGSEEYLRAVAANNNYEQLLVQDSDGNIFIEVKQPAVNLFETELIRLKLIPRVRVSADIFYHKELLGKVEALWLDKSIYVYAYAFLVALLLFAVVLLSRRILRAKATLEQMVKERTLTLTERTEELRYSEELHRITIGSISDPVFITDDNFRFTYIGENVSQILGYSAQEIQAIGDIKSLVKNDFFSLEHLKNTGEIRNIESSITGKDGKKHFFLINVKYVSIKNGTILYTFHEVSELKHAYDSVTKSEKSYRTLAENLPGLVYRLFLKENSRMQFFNTLLEPMTGYQETDLTSGTIRLVQPGIIETDRKRIASAMEKAIQEKAPIDVEYRFQHKSGEIRYFHERGKPVFDEEDTPLYVDGVIFDITDNKNTLIKQHKLEEQLRQAQKLEALGALAGGITHDFNNILSAIFGYTQLALVELPDDSPVKTYLNNMFDAAKRARELVKQILTFSRQETQKQFPVEVRVIIKEALKLLRASIPATIEIRQNIAPHCGNVLANPTQIHQILMNLCINAYHAMRETGGILSVSLTPLDAANCSGAISGFGLRPGPCLRLEVTDTGHGMDRQTLDRIFDPYFTTKARGEGTGMGLSVVHGIVKSHGGQITVSSEPAKGTTFQIYWPVIEQEAFQGEAFFTEPLPSGTEKILLLDDEEQTLRVEETILKSLGYAVHAFTSPLAALECFRDQPGAFDLIVTDMTMPVMTGDNFSREILKVRPGMPIILCTGYSETISETETKQIGIKAFIFKPIEIKTFAVLLREILGSA